MKHISKLSATTIIGAYNDYNDSYNITLNNDTTIFKESILGWPSRMSFIPESGISLNNIYYTFKNGQIYSHNNTERNTFYGATQPVASTIKIAINDEASRIKNFKTLFYEGSEGWTAPTIETDQQSGQVLYWDKKENIYYNWIKGVSNTWNDSAQSGSLDTQEFSVQGVDIVSTVTASSDYSQTATITVNNSTT